MDDKYTQYGIAKLNELIQNPAKHCNRCWFFALATRGRGDGVWGSYCNFLKRFVSPAHPLCSEYDFIKRLLEVL